MSRTLPGDLTSPTAGAILRRGMMVHGVVTAPDGCDVVFDDMLVHEATPHGTTVVSGYGISLADPARLSVDPNDELTRDACARWLSRHLQNWQPWEITRAASGTYWPTYASISVQLGLVVERWKPYPPEAEVIVRWCLAAGGR